MAIGKAGVQLNLINLSIKFGDINIIQNGKLISIIMRDEASII